MFINGKYETEGDSISDAMMDFIKISRKLLYVVAMSLVWKT